MKKRFQNGQMLVTLLFFMVISITIVSAAVVMIILTSESASSIAQGTDAYYIAESGAENGVIRVLRDPNYTGETLTVGSGTAQISVSGSGAKTITSIGRSGNYMRKIQVVTGYTNNILSIQSWQEVR